MGDLSSRITFLIHDCEINSPCSGPGTLPSPFTPFRSTLRYTTLHDGVPGGEVLFGTSLYRPMNRVNCVFRRGLRKVPPLCRVTSGVTSLSSGVIDG